MNRSPRTRFWVETGLATAAGIFTVLTALWKDWIEIVFGADPDHHSGSLEWLLAAGTLAVAICFCIAARHEWLRARPGGEALGRQT
jgi:hypothetical protein